MIKGSNCREEVCEAAIAIINKKGENAFSINEVLDYLVNKGTSYKTSTIRTHITSRCCKNAPQNHGTKYDDFERISNGCYKVIGY